jgi:UDP-N-acetylmuramate dehydrogenase
VIEFLEDVPLAPMTTLGVGGSARFFVRVGDVDSLVEALGYVRERGLAVFVLGGGSNIVVSDRGFDGLVVRLSMEAMVMPPAHPGGSALVTVGAGVDWDEFVAQCVKADLAGVECLSGIPGTVGGTPIQNVGAYGQDVSETIREVECLDRETLEIVKFSNEDCGFSYRASIFNREKRDRYVVLSVTFELEKGGPPKVAYKDLAERFTGRSPSLGEVREAVLDIRRSKSMVIDENDPNSRSAGSFFKNPIVSQQKLDGLREIVPDIVSFPAGEGQVKLSAAWLIEHAGFHKGFAMGRAGISTNHSLAIINRGGATAAEILALRDAIRAGVYEKFGVELVQEPLLVGF